jgi:VCBS repeat-containing protein
MRTLIRMFVALGCVFVLGAVIVPGLAVGAQDTTAERSVDTSSPDPGETVLVTTTVTLDSEAEVDFADRFDPGFASAELVSVELAGEEQSTVFESTNGGGVVVLVESAGPGELVLSYELEIPQDAAIGEEYSFDGLINLDGEPVTVEGVSTLTVGQAGTSTFEVGLDPVDEVTAGSEITVEYTVENTGDVEGTQEIRFTVANSQVDSETVTLGAGERTTGTFSYVTTDEDSPEIPVAVTGDNDTATVTVTVNQANQSGTGDDTDDDTDQSDDGTDTDKDTGGGDGFGPGFGAVAAGLAAVFLTGYTLLRRDAV